MKGNKTFAMIKPNAVEDGNTGAILSIIEKAGFKICAMQKVWLSKNEAKEFYAIHKERPFFEALINFITRSPLITLVLEKDNAVETFRKLIGATNPEEAAANSIRKLFAKSIEENAVHGSDSNENALIEIQFHFSGKDIF